MRMPLKPLLTICLATLLSTSSCLGQRTANAAEKAAAAYQAHRYKESAALYQEALLSAKPEDRGDVEYNLACSQARAADETGALQSLRDAVADGFIDRAHAAEDTDLASLHAMPEWPALLESMSLREKANAQRWGTLAFKTPYQANLTDAEKVAGLSELWSEAKFGFANFWHVPALDWDRAYRDFLPQVVATRSTSEYYRVLQRFYALLADGHTGVYPPEELAGGRLALETALVDGRVLVLGSRDPAFEMQGLHPGDELLQINGRDVRTWAETEVAPYVSASSPQDRDSRIYFRDLLRAPIGTSFTIRTRNLAGVQSTHLFPVTAWAGKREPLFLFKMLPGGIAYVALNGFDDDTAAKEWDRHWAELRSSKGIVLDMRGNGGGDDSVGSHILATLLDANVATPHQESTRWIATYQAWGRAQTQQRFDEEFLLPDTSRHFGGPVVMLTSEKTYSAGEDMVVTFRTAHRGRILGEPTGGSTGQPLRIDLPGGGTARVCTKHDSSPDGKEFVGVGVMPDRLVHQTREDIAAGRDTALSAALEELRANMSPR